MTAADPRRGVVLIIVAGVCAVLATLALSFLVRMRADAADAARLTRTVQARAMLFAACNYLIEAGRIGWERDAYQADGSHSGRDLAGNVLAPADRHAETYGWVDVRDGFMGPKRQAYEPAYIAAMDTDPQVVTGLAALQTRQQTTGFRPVATPPPAREVDALRLRVKQLLWPPTNRDDGSVTWPVGEARRFPMHAWQRPPCAVSPAPPNPILTTETEPALAPSDPRFGLPLLANPDPQPARIADPATWRVDPADWRFGHQPGGSPALLHQTLNLAWFRLLRDGPATFVVTCGAGGTQGFRDWSEVDAASAAAYFAGDEAVFRELLAQEVRLWFRVEWSPAIGFIDYQMDGANGPQDGYSSNAWGRNSTAYQDRGTQWPSRTNVAGTIQWVQRLRQPPEVW